MRFGSCLWITLVLLGLVACGRQSELGPAIFPTAPPAATPTLQGAGDQAPPTSPVTREAASVPTSPVSRTPPPTVAPTATPVPTPTPSATPRPEIRLELARQFLAQGNLHAASDQYRAALMEELSPEATQEARLALGQTLVSLGLAAEAVAVLNDYLAAAGSEVAPEQVPGGAPEGALSLAALDHPGQAYFHLARAYEALADWPRAAAAYERYLTDNPGLAAYVQPRLARTYQAMADSERALLALEAAAAAPAHRLTVYANRRALAEQYAQLGQYAAAAAQHLSLHDVVATERSKGEALYQAGLNTALAGDEAGALALFARAVNEHPRAYDSYLALTALVAAGIPVDDFQRGLVDYHARAYGPAVAALSRFIAAGQAGDENYRLDSHLYLAWSYEGLGDRAAAVAQLEAYAGAGPAGADQAARSQLEIARLYFRAQAWEASRDAYRRYVDLYPAGPEAAAAAWWYARLSELTGAGDAARAAYASLADSYPTAEEAPQARFRAGLLAFWQDDPAGAAEQWRQLRRTYPDHSYAAAAFIWAQRLEIEPNPSATPGANEGLTAPPRTESQASYYPQRARDIAMGRRPFAAPEKLNLAPLTADQVLAERWLQQILEQADDSAAGQLSPALVDDSRLQRGFRLWQLDLKVEAKNELEALREAHADDVLASYRLALFFRDLGLYRSSILAATSVLVLSNTNAFTAPRYIGQLAYPVYYADLILPLAENYGYDPLLQFALVRQESLFESFIASPVGAQGLSQVMPATGEYIAAQLNWPDYRTTELLRPDVGLAFGAFYLQQQLSAFDGSVHTALAAYNAGPGNAVRWYQTAGDDLDYYVEVVNFPETRLYIERIYLGYALYRHLYGAP